MDKRTAALPLLLSRLAGADIKMRKQLLRFEANAQKCHSCRFFLWTMAGEQNRCLFGDFRCGPNHGCSAYSVGRPTHCAPRADWPEIHPRSQTKGV